MANDDLPNAPRFYELAQRGEKWTALRLGRPSASQFHRIVTDKGNRATRTATTYKFELLAERIFRVPFQRPLEGVGAVQWGIDHEDEARAELAKFLHAKIRPGGLVVARDESCCASPDGFIDDEPVEIKCPQVPGQLRNLLQPPYSYWPQVQGQLLLTGQDVLHFWSWHPHVPPAYHVVVRDPPACRTLDLELRSFCHELNADEAKLRQMGRFAIEAYLERQMAIHDEDEHDI